MNEPYTKEELNRALDFINERLALQRKSSSFVTKAMYQAALAILLLARKYIIEPKTFKFSLYRTLKFEVDKIISNLALTLLENTKDNALYDTDDEDRENIVLRYINSEDNAIEDKINDYTERFKSEMEVITAASVFLGKSANETANIVKANLSTLLGSVFITSARKMDFESYSSLVTSYGVGKYVLSYNNIKRLTTDTIAKSRQNLFIYDEEKKGANSWYVMRGSSYPCSLCDSNVGIHYNSFDLPPYHPNCVCMAIPLNTNRL